MALAVKNTPEAAATHLLDRLSVSILAGVAYVLASIAAVVLIPWLVWHALPPSLTASDLVGVAMAIIAVVALAVGAGLVLLGVRLMGPQPAHGLKGGVFATLVALLLAFFLARGVTGLLEYWAVQGYMSQTVGVVIAIVVTAALGIAAIVLVVRRKSHKWLFAIEDQGWFSAAAYKRTQGQLVRRGTILALLILLGCGVFVMEGRATTTATSSSWTMEVPFTGLVTIRDPKDAAKLIDNLNPPPSLVRVQNKGSSKLLEGQVVSRKEYEDERIRIEEERSTTTKEADKPELPIAVPVLDRFTYKTAVQDKLGQSYVKIKSPGDLEGFKAGDIVELGVYNEKRQALEQSGKTGDELPEKDKNLTPPDISTDYKTLTLLPYARFTLPLVVAIFGAWFAWRLVSVPAFADFLIATEAELNKVSWTTRKRLIQDTVVVLVTVLLMALFILAVDTGWYKLLSWDVIGVLRVDTKSKGTTSEQPW
jgi:preprotein translocase SecE subunit